MPLFHADVSNPLDANPSRFFTLRRRGNTPLRVHSQNTFPNYCERIEITNAQECHLPSAHVKQRTQSITQKPKIHKNDMTMVKVSILFLLFPGTQAFVPHTAFIRKTSLASVLEDSKLEPVDFDLERAKQCAEHFGECSVEEMERLRDS